MAETFLLEVATPERLLLQEQVSEVEIPGLDGILGILPGHAPLISGLGSGVLVYTVSGVLSALAGLIILARMVSAQPTAGQGYELNVIAAAAIGGTSLSGGEGSILGTFIGAAIVGVIENGMVLLGIDTYAQQAVTGAVIVLAVALDQWRKGSRT